MRAFTPLEKIQVPRDRDSKSSLTGFTFVELMVVILIFSIITAGLYGILLASMTAIRESIASNIILQQKARGVIDIMSQEFRLADNISFDTAGAVSGDTIRFSTIDGQSMGYQFLNNSIIRVENNVTLISGYVEKINNGVDIFTSDGNSLAIRYRVTGVPVWRGKTFDAEYICGKVNLRND